MHLAKKSVEGLNALKRGRVKGQPGRGPWPRPSSVIVMCALLSEDVRLLPKCELHAHLNGSLGPRTVQSLLRLHRDRHPEEEAPGLPEGWNSAAMGGGDGNRDKDETFEAVFAMFPLAQRLTSFPEAVRMAVRGVAEEFREDGVRYLELRSTPRATDKMTEEEYVEALVNEIIQINEQEEQGKHIRVRLLLSIDRRQGLKKAANTVSLAKRHQVRTRCWRPNLV